jgi:hypothetical protein
VSGLDTQVDRVVSGLEDRLDEVSATVVGRIGQEVGELETLASPQLEETLRGTTLNALQSELSFMRHGRQVPQSAPPDVVEAARLAALARLPPTVILQTHRIGHEVVWNAYVEEVDRLGLEAALRRDVLEAGSRFLFGYVEALARFVQSEHGRELARLRTSSAKVRTRAVLDLLECRTEAADGLGYDLRLVHVACVASGPEAAGALRALGELLDRRVLLVQPAEDVVWAWLGGGPLGERDGSELDGFHPGEATVGLGEPAAALDGFRTSHVQALDAHGIAARTAQRMARYRDVALEAPALRDERSARQFVEVELGPVGSDDRAAALKDTLRTYFACAQNAAATAAALGLHEQTVAQRLRAVEERIGGSVNGRRAQLDAALRVEALLEASSSRPT